MQRPDPFRKNRPHPQEGGTAVPGFRNEAVEALKKKKDLGQHYLRDQGVLDSVVGASRLQPGQRLLEIGPGPGGLTDRLSMRVGDAGKIIAIEADAAIAKTLVGKWPNVEIVVGDAVQTDLAAFGRFDRIVANLPYLISGPITVAFLELLRDPATAWGHAVLMYQKEFGMRLLAHAGDDAYGRLSVHAARLVDVKKVRDVPPGAFDPPPKVDSIVVSLTPHAAPPFEVVNEKVWTAVVDGSFQQRRKQLRNTIPPAVAGMGIPPEKSLAVLAEMGIASERPEQIAPAIFADLVRRLEANK